MSALWQDIQTLLGQLSTLSEAPAGNLEAHISRSAPESSAPTGGLIGSDRSAETIRDRSLWDYYRLAFERHADDPERLLSLYLAGKREYHRRVNPAAHARTVEKGSINALSEDGAVVESVAALNVIKDFAGVQAIDVAIVEGKTEAWVRKVRVQNGRRPDDGRERPQFLDMDEDERHRTVAALAASMGQKRAADKLGVAKSTIQPYWPAPATVAA